MSTNDLSTSKIPTVIVDDLNIKYRVILGANTGSAAGALRSLVSGKAPSQVVKSVHAVKGVSLTAYEGDTIGLVGRNGSGKSSLLRPLPGYCSQVLAMSTPPAKRHCLELVAR